MVKGALKGIVIAGAVGSLLGPALAAADDAPATSRDEAATVESSGVTVASAEAAPAAEPARPVDATATEREPAAKRRVVVMIQDPSDVPFATSP